MCSLKSGETHVLREVYRRCLTRLQGPLGHQQRRPSDTRRLCCCNALDTGQAGWQGYPIHSACLSDTSVDARFCPCLSPTRPTCCPRGHQGSSVGRLSSRVGHCRDIFAVNLAASVDRGLCDVWQRSASSHYVPSSTCSSSGVRSVRKQFVWFQRCTYVFPSMSWIDVVSLTPVNSGFQQRSAR